MYPSHFDLIAFKERLNCLFSERRDFSNVCLKCSFCFICDKSSALAVFHAKLFQLTVASTEETVDCDQQHENAIPETQRNDP